MIPEDGIYEESIDSSEPAEALLASGFLASAIPSTPPQEWFENPKLTKATPLTVDETGRVFGHIAAWHVNHIGMPRSTRPPRSKSKYAYFHTGVVRTESGKDIPVGQLTLAGGHASLQADAAAAAKHYDDTASAIADVHAGEDDYGIWVAGSLRPDATEAQIRALRASAPSGDWRPIGGSLELVAVCQVNVPGFPIARAIVAGGQVMALVAAGAHYMAVMKSTAATSLSTQAQILNELGMYAESFDLNNRVEAAKNKMYGDFAYISQEERMKAADKGQALPDGSFPIKTKDDVKAAIHAYGRAKPSHKAAVRKHIIKRAHQLKVADLIPENWIKGKTIAASAQIDALRERALIASAAAELASISEEERKILAEEGKALPDGSYPIRNEADLKNAIHAYGRAKAADRAKVRNHIAKRAKQLGVPAAIPDDWKTAASAEAESLVASMRSRIASISEFKDYSEGTRKKYAESGEAMPDGSYPIADAGDLEDAIRSFGRASNPDAVKAHIIKRARALGKLDLIPSQWGVIASASEFAEAAPAPGGATKEDIKTLIEAKSAADKQTAEEVKAAKQLHEDKVSGKLAEEAKKAATADKKENKYAETGETKFTPDTQPRDARGKYREVLARLSEHLGDAGLQDALTQAQEANKLDFAGNYEASSKASAALLDTLDRLDSKALNSKSLENVKTTARELGKTLANLPLPFGQDTEKLRFSDLPAGLQDLMKNMADRVIQKIGKKDGEAAVANIRSYMSGGDYFNQSEVQSELGKMLRLLT